MTIASGGVIPSIHSVLLPKKSDEPLEKHSSAKEGLPLPLESLSIGPSLSPSSSSSSSSSSSFGQQYGDRQIVGSEQRESKRPVVRDALDYLSLVKEEFSSQPQVYETFLDIMKQFKANL